MMVWKVVLVVVLVSFVADVHTKSLPKHHGLIAKHHHVAKKAHHHLQLEETTSDELKALYPKDKVAVAMTREIETQAQHTSEAIQTSMGSFITSLQAAAKEAKPMSYFFTSQQSYLNEIVAGIMKKGLPFVLSQSAWTTTSFNVEYSTFCNINVCQLNGSDSGEKIGFFVYKYALQLGQQLSAFLTAVETAVRRTGKTPEPSVDFLLANHHIAFNELKHHLAASDVAVEDLLGVTKNLLGSGTKTRTQQPSATQIMFTVYDGFNGIKTNHKMLGLLNLPLAVKEVEETQPELFPWTERARLRLEQCRSLLLQR